MKTLSCLLLLLLLTACAGPSYEDSQAKRIADLEEYSQARYSRGWSDGAAQCEERSKHFMEQLIPPPGCLIILTGKFPMVYLICEEQSPERYHYIMDEYEGRP